MASTKSDPGQITWLLKLAVIPASIARNSLNAFKTLSFLPVSLSLSVIGFAITTSLTIIDHILQLVIGYEDYERDACHHQLPVTGEQTVHGQTGFMATRSCRNRKSGIAIGTLPSHEPSYVSSEEHLDYVFNNDDRSERNILTLSSNTSSISCLDVPDTDNAKGNQDNQHFRTMSVEKRKELANFNGELTQEDGTRLETFSSENSSTLADVSDNDGSNSAQRAESSGIQEEPTGEVHVVSEVFNETTDDNTEGVNSAFDNCSESTNHDARRCQRNNDDDVEVPDDTAHTTVDSLQTELSGFDGKSVGNCEIKQPLDGDQEQAGILRNNGFCDTEEGEKANLTHDMDTDDRENNEAPLKDAAKTMAPDCDVLNNNTCSSVNSGLRNERIKFTDENILETDQSQILRQEHYEETSESVFENGDDLTQEDNYEPENNENIRVEHSTLASVTNVEAFHDTNTENPADMFSSRSDGYCDENEDDESVKFYAGSEEKSLDNSTLMQTNDFHRTSTVTNEVAQNSQSLSGVNDTEPSTLSSAHGNTSTSEDVSVSTVTTNERKQKKKKRRKTKAGGSEIPHVVQ